MCRPPWTPPPPARPNAQRAPPTAAPPQPHQVCACLPSERSPTVSQLVDGEFLAIEVVLGEQQARSLIPLVKRLGATGILTYPISCIVH